MHSLRTTLALSALGTISDLTAELTTALDPFLDSLLHNLFKAAGSTKKLISQAAAAATTALLVNTSYHARTLQSLHKISTDKNVQIRALAAGYIKVLLETHGHSRKDMIEKTGGM